MKKPSYLSHSVSAATARLPNLGGKGLFGEPNPSEAPGAPSAGATRASQAAAPAREPEYAEAAVVLDGVDAAPPRAPDADGPASSAVSYERTAGMAAYEARLEAEKGKGKEPWRTTRGRKERFRGSRHERTFLERFAFRTYKRSREQVRAIEDRLSFGDREEMIHARRYDDMRRRMSDDVEFEHLMKRGD